MATLIDLIAQLGGFKYLYFPPRTLGFHSPIWLAHSLFHLSWKKATLDKDNGCLSKVSFKSAGFCGENMIHPHSTVSLPLPGIMEEAPGFSAWSDGMLMARSEISGEKTHLGCSKKNV